jgi:hypothetical protein
VLSECRRLDKMGHNGLVAEMVLLGPVFLKGRNSLWPDDNESTSQWAGGPARALQGNVPVRDTETRAASLDDADGHAANAQGEFWPLAE